MHELLRGNTIVLPAKAAHLAQRLAARLDERALRARTRRRRCGRLLTAEALRAPPPLALPLPRCLAAVATAISAPSVAPPTASRPPTTAAPSSRAAAAPAVAAAPPIATATACGATGATGTTTAAAALLLLSPVPPPRR